MAKKTLSDQDSQPTSKTAQTMARLRDQIEAHNYAYFVLDKPVISDREFDKLFEELLKLEKEHPELRTPDSPTLKVGGAVLDAFVKMEHRTPMLSLQNSYSPEDILAFDERVRRALGSKKAIEYYGEPKLDGLAIELIYENGRLTHAITRGDGLVGEEVTHNVRTIKSVPLKLQRKVPLLEVRGEILMFKEDFKKLNEEQIDEGDEPFANPRNAAAGTIRQLDPSITAGRNLRFFAYGLGDYRGIEITSQENLFAEFQKLGLPSMGGKFAKVCDSVNDALEYYRNMEERRHSLAFDIDGVVVKVNSWQLQSELGFVARSPRWATAAKYEPEQAETIVEKIWVSVGRTGALTPVVVMKPVQVGGVTITNATLHNQDEVERKDVRVGDTILVRRAGDVIPEVVSIVEGKRPKGTKPFRIPDKCPICDTRTVRIEGEAATRCPNVQCPARIKQSLMHFCGRRQMNIEGLGDRWIEILVDKGMVQSFSDLYRLTVEDLLTLDRQGEKLAGKIIKNIEASKKAELARFIGALGIKFVGEQTAKYLAKKYGAIERVMSASFEELQSVEEIGPRVAEAVSSAFKDKNLKKDIQRMLELGVEFERPRAGTNKLQGLTFVITGTLPVPRTEAQEVLERNGAHVGSSVSKKTDYLLAGEDAGSKLDKAREVGTKIVSWEDLQKMI